MFVNQCCFSFLQISVLRAVCIIHTVESVDLLKNLINTKLKIFPRWPLCFCVVVCVISSNLSFSTCWCHSFSLFIKGFSHMSLLIFLTNKTLLCLLSPAVPALCHRGLAPPSGRMVSYTLMSECFALPGPSFQPLLFIFNMKETHLWTLNSIVFIFYFFFVGGVKCQCVLCGTLGQWETAFHSAVHVYVDECSSYIDRWISYR